MIPHIFGRHSSGGNDGRGKPQRPQVNENNNSSRRVAAASPPTHPELSSKKGQQHDAFNKFHKPSPHLHSDRALSSRDPLSPGDLVPPTRSSSHLLTPSLFDPSYRFSSSKGRLAPSPSDADDPHPPVFEPSHRVPSSRDPSHLTAPSLFDPSYRFFPSKGRLAPSPSDANYPPPPVFEPSHRVPSSRSPLPPGDLAPSPYRSSHLSLSQFDPSHNFFPSKGRLAPSPPAAEDPPHFPFYLPSVTQPTFCNVTPPSFRVIASERLNVHVQVLTAIVGGIGGKLRFPVHMLQGSARPVVVYRTLEDFLLLDRDLLQENVGHVVPSLEEFLAKIEKGGVFFVEEVDLRETSKERSEILQNWLFDVVSGSSLAGRHLPTKDEVMRARSSASLASFFHHESGTKHRYISPVPSLKKSDDENDYKAQALSSRRTLSDLTSSSTLLCPSYCIDIVICSPNELDDEGRLLSDSTSSSTLSGQSRESQKTPTTVLTFASPPGPLPEQYFRKPRPEGSEHTHYIMEYLVKSTSDRSRALGDVLEKALASCRFRKSLVEFPSQLESQSGCVAVCFETAASVKYIEQRLSPRWDAISASLMGLVSQETLLDDFVKKNSGASDRRGTVALRRHADVAAVAALSESLGAFFTLRGSLFVGPLGSLTAHLGEIHSTFGAMEKCLNNLCSSSSNTRIDHDQVEGLVDSLHSASSSEIPVATMHVLFSYFSEQQKSALLLRDTASHVSQTIDAFRTPLPLLEEDDFLLLSSASDPSAPAPTGNTASRQQLFEQEAIKRLLQLATALAKQAGSVDANSEFKELISGMSAAKDSKKQHVRVSWEDRSVINAISVGVGIPINIDRADTPKSMRKEDQKRWEYSSLLLDHANKLESRLHQVKGDIASKAVIVAQKRHSGKVSVSEDDQVKLKACFTKSIVDFLECHVQGRYGSEEDFKAMRSAVADLWGGGRKREEGGNAVDEFADCWARLTEKINRMKKIANILQLGIIIKTFYAARGEKKGGEEEDKWSQELKVISFEVHSLLTKASLELQRSALSGKERHQVALDILALLIDTETKALELSLDVCSPFMSFLRYHLPSP